MGRQTDRQKEIHRYELKPVREGQGDGEEEKVCRKMCVEQRVRNIKELCAII